jgi:hypothetical protein
MRITSTSQIMTNENKNNKLEELSLEELQTLRIIIELKLEILRRLKEE